MRTDQDLVAAANRNYVASYRKLAEHCAGGETRDGNGPFAFVTGVPLALFNGCVVVEPVSPTALEAAIAWLGHRRVPHRVWIADGLVPGLGEVPLAHGFQTDERLYPGMVLHPVPDQPSASMGVTVERVAAAGLERFLNVLIEAGMPSAACRRLFTPAFAEDPDVQLFVGHLGRRPVGTSVAIRSDDVSGIYAVGTLPAARRHGVGTALTWAAVAAGEAWGCGTIVLQASEMGLPIYVGMGFRTVVDYTIFASPPRP